MGSFSLFELPSDGFGVTELIKSLIQIISYDIYDVKRNVLSIYHVIEGARDLYKEINNFLALAESDDGNNWENFDKFTKAIDPLEGILFDLSKIIEREVFLLLPEGDSDIADCVEFISQWALTRRQIQKLLERLQILRGKSTESKGTSSDAQRHGDLNLLAALCRDIATHSLHDNETENPGPVANTKTIASTITQRIWKEVPDESIVLSIKCAMLVQGVMQVAVTSSDNDVKPKLNKANVWIKAKSLLSNLGTHLDGGKSPTFNAVQAEWDKFVTFLKTQDKPIGEIPSQYYQLKKAIKFVRRPYHSQTLELVHQCHAMAEHFKAHKTAKNLKFLSFAITAAMDAINKAAAAMDHIAIYTKDLETSEAGVAIAAAEVKIMECFIKYQMEDWELYASRMTAALTKDQSRVEQINAKFKNGAVISRLNSRMINVTIKREINGLTDSESITYNTEAITPLNAIFWKIAQSDANLLRGWHFEHMGSDLKKREIIGLDQQVQDIRLVTANLRILYLVQNA